MSSTIIEFISVTPSNNIKPTINLLDEPIKIIKDDCVTYNGKHEYVKISYDENQKNCVNFFDLLKKIDEYGKSNDVVKIISSNLSLKDGDLSYLPIIRISDILHGKPFNYVKIKLDNTETILDYDPNIRINEIKDDVENFNKYIKCTSIIDFIVSIDKLWVSKDPSCKFYTYGFILKFDQIRIYKDNLNILCNSLSHKKSSNTTLQDPKHLNSISNNNMENENKFGYVKFLIVVCIFSYITKKIYNIINF